MPTPILPLLHALLNSLDISIVPSSLASTSPSLLLLVLEKILGSRLPLPTRLRICTPEHEVDVVKCILGVLDEELGKDLTIVDPRQVVLGGQEDLGVVIMALTVLARRKGIDVVIPDDEDEDNPSSEESEVLDLSGDLDLGEYDEKAALPLPLEPDVSLSPRQVADDPFARSHPPSGRGSGSLLFDVPKRHSASDEIEDIDEWKLHGSSPDLPQPRIPPITPVTEDLDPYNTPIPYRIDLGSAIPTHLESYGAALDLESPIMPEDRQQDAWDLDRIRKELSRSSPVTRSSGDGSTRTVLDDILEEFGLDLPR